MDINRFLEINEMSEEDYYKLSVEEADEYYEIFERIERQNNSRIVIETLNLIYRILSHTRPELAELLAEKRNSEKEIILLYRIILCARRWDNAKRIVRIFADSGLNKDVFKDSVLKIICK